MLTPLSFVCTAELLTAEHGKKIKLLQFMLKSVTPKLQSFKLISSPVPRTNHPRYTVASPEDSARREESWTSEGRVKAEFPFSVLSYPSSVHTEKPRAKSIASLELGRNLTKPWSGYRQRTGTLPDNKVNPGALEQQIHQRPWSQRFSDVQSSSIPIFPPHRSRLLTAHDHVALVRPGQRIVSPSVLHGWFPSHDVQGAKSADLPSPPPPPRVRPDDQKPQ